MPKQKKSKNKIKAIIFDIDGVLVDVTQSYRVAIKKTAEFFLGTVLTMQDVEEIKNRGINDDYDAAELLIQERGGSFREDVIIKKFQEYYQGRKFDGLIKNEKCLISEKTLKALKKYKLAIFTGRPKIEAEFCLKRFNIKKYLKAIVAKEDVNESKPSPEGLLKIIKALKVNNNEAIYVGDNVADLRSAKNANINFIGVCPPYANKQYLKTLFKSEGAEIVLNDVNDIKKVF